jgi:hypothetical protein
LATEVIRLAVTSVSADLDNNRIVFKAILPAGTVDTITEVGIYYFGNFDTRQLVARTVLTTPQTVSASIPTEIEYTLGITV